MRLRPALLLFFLFGSGNLAWGVTPAPGFEFSRLIIYDTRGSDAEETVIIFDQHSRQVSVWMKNYLGERRGEVPAGEYLGNFNALLAIPAFALKAEYRGKPLRAHAAHGTVTLAWKDASGKQIRTIRYYAPEHNLEDFRTAFNSLWALSRYAILSLNSLESPNSAVREDALVFMAGAGWLTVAEVDDVLEHYRSSGQGARVARALWASLDTRFSAGSDFANPAYLDYCVQKGMTRLGAPAAEFLSARAGDSERKIRLARKILADIKR
jgi:hypothetical protein